MANDGLWVRSYVKELTDPRFAQLSNSDFRLVHGMRLIAAEHAIKHDAEGYLPDIEEMAKLLGTFPKTLQRKLANFVESGIFFEDEPGLIRFADWDKYFRKGDRSAERQARCRAKKKSEQIHKDQAAAMRKRIADVRVKSDVTSDAVSRDIANESDVTFCGVGNESDVTTLSLTSESVSFPSRSSIDSDSVGDAYAEPNEDGFPPTEVLPFGSKLARSFYKKSRLRPLTKHVPTPETRKRVQASIGLGGTQDVIAQLLGISTKTLTRHYKNEIATGTEVACQRVAARLFQQCLSDSDAMPATAARMFFLKCRGRWRETSVVEHAGPDGAPLPPHPAPPD